MDDAALISMWWTAVQLALLLLVLTCLVQCAAPPTTQKRESHPAPTKRATSSKAKITLEVKQPNTKERQTARSMVKPAATTRKVTTKKMTSPTPLKEFSLNEILFRGRQSNEANAFIKANDQRGKTLELTYEHVREQDLNDIEALVRKRNEIR